MNKLDKPFSYDDYLQEQLKDPEFQKAWIDSEPAYQLKRLRLLKKLSQSALAKKVGTRQPSIARLESGYGVNNLGFLRRVAEALDAEVEIRLKPKVEAAQSRKPVTYTRAKRRTTRKLKA
jgi:transcriptional regulator with XRE-family HTH domain